MPQTPQVPNPFYYNSDVLILDSHNFGLYFVSNINSFLNNVFPNIVSFSSCPRLFSVFEAFCINLFMGRCEHSPTLAKWGIDDRPMYVYHQSPTHELIMTFIWNFYRVRNGSKIAASLKPIPA